MSFAHDTRSALESTAALVCTLGPPDSLESVADLDKFITFWRYQGRFDRSAAELEQVRELRHRLRQLWELDVDDCALLVNDLLLEGNARPHLARHDGWDWHLHATTHEQPLVERLAVESAVAMMDVIRAGETWRMKECANEECDGVLVDLSKNRSRQYCSRECGNRLHVAAYRARLAGE